MSTSSERLGQHPAAPMLAKYVSERATDFEAWSVEAHVLFCPQCSSFLAASTASTPIAEHVAVSKSAVLTVVGGEPAPARTAVARDGSTASSVEPSYRPLSMFSRAMLGRAPWIVAVVVVAVASVLADLAWRLFDAPINGQVDSLAMLIGPILPSAGVAFVYSRSADPCAEVVLSTPSAGLQMVLWRTLSVLVVATPVATVLGASSGSVTAGALLLATLALTVTTLAVGSRYRLEVAAIAVATAWAAVVIVPSLALTRLAVPVYSEPAMGWWVGAIGLSAAVVVARRDGFERVVAGGHGSGRVGW